MIWYEEFISRWMIEPGLSYLTRLQCPVTSTHFAHHYQEIECIAVLCLDIDRSFFGLLGIGIDLKNRRTNLSVDEDYIVMIDDAQAKYEETYLLE